MKLKIIKSNKPIKIDEDNWIYHDMKGRVQVIHRVVVNGLYVQTDNIKIKRQLFYKIFTQDKEVSQ